MLTIWIRLQIKRKGCFGADYRTGQEGEGSGFGGSFSGRSVKGVKDGTFKHLKKVNLKNQRLQMHQY